MAKLNEEQIDEILRKHQMWLDGDSAGDRANLSNADLRGANLSSANLYSANLSKANLSSANLYGANLSFANLSGANLSFANLSGANLTRATMCGANLEEVRSLLVASGNMMEIETVQCETWPVAYTASHMQIGCQLHKLDDWWSYSDERISRMSVDALSWWQKWKPVLKLIIDTSPAI